MLFYRDPLQGQTVLSTIRIGEGRGRKLIRVALSKDEDEVHILSQTFNTGHVSSQSMTLPLGVARQLFPQLEKKMRKPPSPEKELREIDEGDVYENLSHCEPDICSLDNEGQLIFVSGIYQWPDGTYHTGPKPDEE